MPIAGDGVPPAAGMRNKGDVASGVYRIVPSAPQVPPRGWGASARVCTAPPLASMIRSLPCAKNPRLRLSGDQKGKLASSVPANGCAAVESSGRTQSWGALRRPSPQTPAWCHREKAQCSEDQRSVARVEECLLAKGGRAPARATQIRRQMRWRLLRPPPLVPTPVSAKSAALPRRARGSRPASRPRQSIVVAA